MRRGLVALGDSITRGRGGTDALGVPHASWALWLAEALALPYTNLAADGALTADVLGDQVPRLRGPYDLALLYTGVNDTRSLGWNAEAYVRDVRAILTALREAAARVLVLTLPEDLGRPTAAPKPAAANAILGSTGAQLVDLRDFGGRRHVLPDAVHPTSLGQLEIADRVARALGAPRLPSAAADPPRGEPAFAWWWTRLWARDVLRRRRERRAAGH